MAMYSILKFSIIPLTLCCFNGKQSETDFRLLFSVGPIF